MWLLWWMWRLWRPWRRWRQWQLWWLSEHRPLALEECFEECLAVVPSGAHHPRASDHHPLRVRQLPSARRATTQPAPPSPKPSHSPTAPALRLRTCS
jgi:hypothetical protein